MPFTLTILWTDAVFYLLIITLVIFSLWQSKQAQQTWRKIWQSRIGISSGVILFFYFLIAFLDSIHFYTYSSAQVQSVLDLILSPLNQPLETTYLRPFSRATTGDVLSILISTFPIVLFICSIMALLIYFIKPNICRWTFLLTSSLMIFIAVSLYALSREYHIFGTDKIGQDVFYQALKSIRTGVLIGTLTTMVMLPFALLLGTMAGYFRGWVDDVIQYVYTTLSSIPSVLLIVAMVLMLEVFMGHHPQWFVSNAARADARLFALCVILGITSWTNLCRLVRAETLKLRELDYVMAAKSLGATHVGIILKHILPNLMHIILITIVLDFSALVLAEAVLSYIGVGVDPSMQSFGNMINSARLELAREPIVWWSLTAAFIFMFILVLAANLFADVVRDVLDPHLQ